MDKILQDGEEIRYENLSLTAFLTPGYMEGNTIWTTTIEEKGRRYSIIFVGSMSINEGVELLNTLHRPAIDQAYAKYFQVLNTLPYDIFLGHHAPFSIWKAKLVTS